MLKQHLSSSALVNSIVRSLRRSLDRKLLRRSYRLVRLVKNFPEKKKTRSPTRRRMPETPSSPNEEEENAHRLKKYFDEDYSEVETDYEFSDDADSEDDDSEEFYPQKRRKVAESSDSEDSENSEDSEGSEDFEGELVMNGSLPDEEELEFEMEALQEDIDRIEMIVEKSFKKMTDDEKSELRQRYAMKKKQLAALEEMMEMKFMMEEMEEEREGGIGNPKVMESSVPFREIDVLEELDEMERMEYLDNMRNMNDMDESDQIEYLQSLRNINEMDSTSDQDHPVDLLQQHIEDHGLGLVFRPLTRSQLCQDFLTKK